ncbi:MAG: type IV secretion system protein [Azoarcus sp.]|jgi:type IV secretion system protein VirB8|nr:type IV secretion system protein [Azoarcus sp.]
MRFPFFPKSKQQPPAPADEVATPVKSGRAVQTVSPKRLPQTFVDAALDFERSKNETLQRTNKLLVKGIAGAIAFAFVCVVGILMSFALHREPQPTILRLDNTTGNIDVLTSIKDANNSYDEVVNRYWVANYVKTCERYDWYSIGVDFDSCELFSSSDVFTAHSNKVKAKNAPLEMLKDKGRIDVRIVSVSFLDSNTASVRFTSQKLTAAGENPDGSPLQRWIATVVFEFDAGLMTDQQRMVNPLGFKVLSYQVNPEAIGRE